MQVVDVTASWGDRAFPGPHLLLTQTLECSRREGAPSKPCLFLCPSSSGPTATEGASGVGLHPTHWQSWHPHLLQPPCYPLSLPQ